MSNRIVPANYALKLSRPGFGPALKRLYYLFSKAGGTPTDIPLAPLVAARTCGRRDRAASGRGPWPRSLAAGPLGGLNAPPGPFHTPSTLT
jgi:hypothetical protein